MLFFQAVIIFNDRGTGPVNGSKGRAQIVGDGPQQGGEIQAESKVGEGTSIRFWLETESIETEENEDEQ